LGKHEINRPRGRLRRWWDNSKTLQKHDWMAWTGYVWLRPVNSVVLLQTCIFQLRKTFLGHVFPTKPITVRHFRNLK